MKTPYRPVRVFKLHRFTLRRLARQWNFYGIWGIPIAMVPCLHQSNNYIKKKLRVCRVQKCHLLVVANSVPTGKGLQTTPFHAVPYRADDGNLQNLGPA